MNACNSFLFWIKYPLLLWTLKKVLYHRFEFVWVCTKTETRESAAASVRPSVKSNQRGYSHREQQAAQEPAVTLNSNHYHHSETGPHLHHVSHTSRQFAATFALPRLWLQMSSVYRRPWGSVSRTCPLHPSSHWLQYVSAKLWTTLTPERRVTWVSA